MRLTPRMYDEVSSALLSAQIARDQGLVERAWQYLARAHIISQPNLPLHLAVHRKMLSLAIAVGDNGEMAGQLLRLALAPLGHLLGKIPWGNIGRATVGITTPSPLPSDIAEMYAEAGIRTTDA